MREWGVRWGGLLGLALLLVSLTPSGALEGVEGVGGTYRYGHIRWTSEGNMVTFTLEVAYKRNITDTSYWKGTAPDLLSQVGDEITLFGRQAPQFYFGDGSVQSVIKAQVTAMSVQQDWVMGAAEMTHRYATPNNKGTPWYAQLVGCCRDASLSNNKDSEYVIAASVDLTAGDRSPRANVLPVVSVPLRPSGWPAVKPSVKVPAQVDIGGAVPFDVRNAADFSSTAKSYLAVSMKPISINARHLCVPFDVGNAADFSSAAKSYLAVSMKAVYVDALGVSHQGFSDPELLQRALGISYDGFSDPAVYVDALGVSHKGFSDPELLQRALGISYDGFSDPTPLSKCDTTVQGPTNNPIP
ncbi:hypothetical protein T484DRAFT_1857553 [Baffinella frigidus]|nr:hypothetical protein T484DRAFT_1857553 [Cryptophyta sp. CCMP2293]